MKVLKTLLVLFTVAILCLFTSFVYADLAPAPWINPAKGENEEGNNQYNYNQYRYLGIYSYNTPLNPYVLPAYVFGPVYSFGNNPNPISVNTLWNTNLSTPWNTNLFTPWNNNLFTQANSIFLPFYF